MAGPNEKVVNLRHKDMILKERKRIEKDIMAIIVI